MQNVTPEQGARSVLVCGSNYGRIYIEALRRTGRYALTGLLAQGSVRSFELARENGVPLFRSLDEVPDRLDLACVALPGSAGQVTLDLLGRGIPVLCEHPLRPDFVQAALAAAAAHRTVFHVNAHFGDLPAGAAFCRSARRHARESAPVLAEVTATERSLYAALDMLARAAGAPDAVWSVSHREEWALLEGTAGGTPVTLRIQRPTQVLADGSPGYLVDIRIALYYPAQILSLLSVAGPVVSSANLGRGMRGGAALWQAIGGGSSPDPVQFHEDRLSANLRALRALERHACGGTALPWQTPGHLLGVSRAWAAAAAVLSTES